MPCPSCGQSTGTCGTCGQAHCPTCSPCSSPGVTPPSSLPEVQPEGLSPSSLPDFQQIALEISEALTSQEQGHGEGASSSSDGLRMACPSGPPLPAPKYTSAQLVGYVVSNDSFKIDGEFTNGLPNPLDDIRARCEAMSEAMNVAHATLGADDADCLKVFMAPEFYFGGSGNGYSLDDYQVLVAELKQLARDPKWDNWLFVFGTIITGSGKGEDEITHNVAFAQKGGIRDDEEDPGTRIVMKEHSAAPDYNAFGLLGANYLPAVRPPGPREEMQRREGDPTGIFVIDGITFALEICRDHDMGRLRRSPPAPGDPEVQIHLIPSGGSAILPKNVVACAGGYAFNCDCTNVGKGDFIQWKGATRRDNSAASSQVVRVTGRAGKKATIEPVHPVSTIVLQDNHGVFKHPGGLNVYGPVKLPDPSYT